MVEYAALTGVSSYPEAFKFIAAASFSALEAAMKKDQVVCVMADDPNSLGPALVCQFLLQKTKGSIKSMR